MQRPAVAPAHAHIGCLPSTSTATLRRVRARSRASDRLGHRTVRRGERRAARPRMRSACTRTSSSRSAAAARSRSGGSWPSRRRIHRPRVRAARPWTHGDRSCRRVAAMTLAPTAIDQLVHREHAARSRSTCARSESSAVSARSRPVASAAFARVSPTSLAGIDDPPDATRSAIAARVVERDTRSGR